jgi:hypothetical protein
VNIRSEPEGFTLLHLAAKSNHPELVSYLIDKGFSIDATDYRGQTPLHVACADGNAIIAVALLKQGADPTLRDKKGLLPQDKCTKSEYLQHVLGDASDKRLKLRNSTVDDKELGSVLEEKKDSSSEEVKCDDRYTDTVANSGEYKEKEPVDISGGVALDDPIRPQMTMSKILSRENTMKIPTSPTSHLIDLDSDGEDEVEQVPSDDLEDDSTPTPKYYAQEDTATIRATASITAALSRETLVDKNSLESSNIGKTRDKKRIENKELRRDVNAIDERVEPESLIETISQPVENVELVHPSHNYVRTSETFSVDDRYHTEVPSDSVSAASSKFHEGDMALESESISEVAPNSSICEFNEGGVEINMTREEKMNVSDVTLHSHQDDEITGKTFGSELDGMTIDTFYDSQPLQHVDMTVEASLVNHPDEDEAFLESINSSEPQLPNDNLPKLNPEILTESMPTSDESAAKESAIDRLRRRLGTSAKSSSSTSKTAESGPYDSSGVPTKCEDKKDEFEVMSPLKNRGGSRRECGEADALYPVKTNRSSAGQVFVGKSSSQFDQMANESDQFQRKTPLDVDRSADFEIEDDCSQVPRQINDVSRTASSRGMPGYHIPSDEPHRVTFNTELEKVQIIENIDSPRQYDPHITEPDQTEEEEPHLYPPPSKVRSLSGKLPRPLTQVDPKLFSATKSVEEKPKHAQIPLETNNNLKKSPKTASSKDRNVSNQSNRYGLDAGETVKQALKRMLQESQNAVQSLDSTSLNDQYDPATMASNQSSLLSGAYTEVIRRSCQDLFFHLSLQTWFSAVNI